MADKPVCSISGCGKPHLARGWCTAHYRRWRLYGDPVEPSRARQQSKCSVPSCGAACNSNGFCSTHYYRWKAYGDPNAPLVRNKWTSPTCSVDGCERPRKNGASMCTSHCLRQWRHGDPLSGRTPNGEPYEFLLAVLGATTNDCVEWPYAKCSSGHANISGAAIGYSTNIASRIICEMAHGAPPTPEHEAAHSCGRGHLGCINPQHLRWRTHQQNMQEIPVHRKNGQGRWGPL